MPKICTFCTSVVGKLGTGGYVCVCVCVYVYECMRMCMHIGMVAGKFGQGVYHMCMCMCICTCLRTCVCMHMYMCVRARMHAPMNV